MVSVLDAAARPLGVTDDGLKLQVAPTGRPLQVKFTCALNPFSGRMLSDTVPLCPATRFMRVSDGGAESEKSAPSQVTVKLAPSGERMDGTP
jgi:hypothetical protein